MKAVIYTRVSSTTERQNTERQVADLKAYAEYRKLEFAGIFEEKISEAKKNSERPVLVEALEYCEANLIDILLLSELSRLGRNAFEVLEVVKRLVDNKHAKRAIYVAERKQAAINLCTNYDCHPIHLRTIRKRKHQILI